MSIDKVVYKSPVFGSSSSNPSVTEGSATVKGQSTLLVADMTSRNLLEGIYLELKKLNLRQESAFEEQVNDGDV